MQWKEVCRNIKNINYVGNHTAAIEGLESSPFSGWVTSAPNIMVGMSLTNGILQLIASRRTVFLPPICTKNVGKNQDSVLGGMNYLESWELFG